VEGICNTFHINYLTADDENSLERGLVELFVYSEKPRLLEIFTPSEINDQVLLDYFEYIR